MGTDPMIRHTFFSTFIALLSYFHLQALACFSVAIAIHSFGLALLVLINIYPQLAYQAGLVHTT